MQEIYASKTLNFFALLCSFRGSKLHFCSSFRIFEYSLLQPDRTHSPCGSLYLDQSHASEAATFVKQGLSFSELSTSSISLLEFFAECVAVNILLKNFSFFSFLNIYAPPIRSSSRGLQPSSTFFGFKRYFKPSLKRSI